MLGIPHIKQTENVCASSGRLSKGVDTRQA